MMATSNQDNVITQLVWLTDLSQCGPDNALSSSPHSQRWHVVDYDAGAIKGKMITAQALVNPPPVHLKLNVHGWHAITIGIWTGIYGDVRIKYRLSSEPIFRTVRIPHHFQFDRTEIFDTFPIYADLSGETLIIAKDRSEPSPAMACVAYVKLRPLTPEEQAEVERDRAQTETRKVIAIQDGNALFTCSNEEELSEQVEIYRHSDVGKVFMGVNIGDLTYYPSKFGRFCYGENEGVFPSLEQKKASDCYKALALSGVTIPFKKIMEHVHSMGLEFHTYYRLAIGDHSHPQNIFPTDSFFVKEHPEWRMVTKDGTPLPKASYAFPEVRCFMVSLIEEAMKYDIDGVNLCFIRGPEYFGYEKPVIDDFVQLYKIDPREIAENDARLLKLRAGYMTDFVRAVRKAADKHAERRGRKLQVSAWIEWSTERMEYFGYDSYTWIREGLLDSIIAIGPTELVELANQRGCSVYGFGSSAWISTPTEQHIHDMKHAYAMGLDGLAIWDLDHVQSIPEKWVVLSRLGHKEEVMDRSPFPAHLPKMLRLKVVSIAGQDLSHTEYKNVPGAVPPEMLTVFTGG